MSHGVFSFFHNTTPVPVQGTIVRYNCDGGYTPNGNTNYQLCDANGDWQLDTPGCLGKLLEC